MNERVTGDITLIGPAIVGMEDSPERLRYAAMEAYARLNGGGGKIHEAAVKLASEVNEGNVRGAVDNYFSRLEEACGDCAFCGCGQEHHSVNALLNAHFFKPPKTMDEWVNARWKGVDSRGETVSLTKVTVDEKPVARAVFCRKCASELETRQTVCYRETVGVGEVVGL